MESVGATFEMQANGPIKERVDNDIVIHHLRCRENRKRMVLHIIKV
jgi:hypothetical protein